MGSLAGSSNFVFDYSNNRVGIGTAAPVEKLEVTGSIRFGASNVGRIYTQDVSSRGNIQISSPNYGSTRAVSYGNNYYIDITGAYQQAATNIGGSAVEMTASNGGYGIFRFLQKQDPDVGGAEREAMRITSAGDVGIGTAAPVYKLDVTGDISSSGTVYAVNFDNVSDAVFKSDIKPILNASAVLNSLSPVEFRWKDNGEKAFGMIAQEVEAVLPEIVHYKPDDTRTVSYIQLIPFLISVVQEQQKQIDDLKKKLN